MLNTKPVFHKKAMRLLILDSDTKDATINVRECHDTGEKNAIEWKSMGIMGKRIPSHFFSCNSLSCLGTSINSQTEKRERVRKIGFNFNNCYK